MQRYIATFTQYDTFGISPDFGQSSGRKIRPYLRVLSQN